MMSLDKDVLIIGAGVSGLNFAIRLQEDFSQASYSIIEASDELGGTWSVNTYPGCGCDVASHFYSYSFALKPDWTQKFALQREILSYVKDVAVQHDIVKNTKFSTIVKKAVWDETYEIWVVEVLDKKTGITKTVKSRALVSAVGGLSVPRTCEIPGAERFKGALFHSAKWNHEFNWENKEVVVIGNGCSATQFVPILSNGSTMKNYIAIRSPVKKVTQFARQPHWLAERPNPEYTPLFKWTMRYVPLAMRLYRFWLYADMEKDFFGFYIRSGTDIRASLTAERLEYMKSVAPERYHSALTPTTEIGCKRKVNDTDYFSCLHNENMELVWDDAIVDVTETGVKTKSGREIHADAIILANGFQTQKVLHPLDSNIRGEGGITLAEHWNQVSNGFAQAYYGTCVSPFPNFFVMMGPNTTTGHLSVIYSTECQVNFSLRLLKPILRKPSLLPLCVSPRPTSVAVTPAAEQRENTWIQKLSKNLVWATGCTSWYIDSKTGRNTMLYPDWQFNFWLRSIFVPKGRDFVYRRSPKDAVDAPQRKGTKSNSQLLWNSAILAAVIGGLGLGAGIAHGEVKAEELDCLLRRAYTEIEGISAEALKHLRF